MGQKLHTLTVRFGLLALAGTALAGCVPQDPRYVSGGPYYRPVSAPRVYYRRAEPVYVYRSERPAVARVQTRTAPARIASPRPAATRQIQIMRDPAGGAGGSNTGGGGGGGSGGGDGGGGSGGGGSGGGGWSDSRLKHSIERVGATQGGLPLYAFNYIWGGERMVGVMAQDLVTTRPDALIVTESGLLKVDYSRIGFTMQPYREWRAAAESQNSH